MIDLQQRVVADRIARLSEEAAAQRMGRIAAAADGRGARLPVVRTAETGEQWRRDRAALRVRVGLWLVSVGEFVSGPPRPAQSERSRGH